MPTPAGAEEIGRYIYLFRAQTEDQTCVIDAHGGFVFENRSFTVPAGVTLKFYTPHGSAVIDEGQFALNVAQFDYTVAEEITGGQPCHNYLLAKAWGTHTFGDDEDDKRITYARAEAMLDAQDDRRTRQTQRFGAPMDSVASLVTIRNRWDLWTGIPLETVIHEVRQVMPTLTTFHCTFCRSAGLHLPWQTPEGPSVTPQLA
ncbi:hypothetical protein KPL78_18530 [Roseomonas sp. HJA6]|uniref:Putative adhesin Stv domain-containing protein n=1 Tax=Roseomonas alba TaxID=2846776 RepID=A0ABS7AC33_9PROT|nr:hypothetical protein [Neoroseomonas alba]MBW6399862.1 hypothetical protein [Neoroseomonas alba]